MQPNMMRVRKRAPLRDAVRTELNESRLRRYAALFQPHVRGLAGRDARLADLAVSFPALLFALAAPRSGFDPTPTIARAIGGANLAELAGAAGIPMWLRKLPPEAFVARIGKLPDGELFRRRIANHLPGSEKLAPAWLRAVTDAADWADETTAVWIARELVEGAEELDLARLRLMSLFAWFSIHPHTRAHAMIDQPWRPALRFKAAIERANKWLRRIDLHLNLGDKPIEDMWLSPGSVGGYEFFPIRSTDEILEEARVMENCLAGYGHSVAHNWTRLFSVRQNGRRVAVLSVSAITCGDPLLNIEEVRGRRNKPVSAELAWAARGWLHVNELPNVVTNRVDSTTLPFHRSTWMSLWRPYWIAKRRIPDWLPLQPSRSAYADLWRTRRWRRRNIGRR